jgi:hypothetical protein
MHHISRFLSRSVVAALVAALLPTTMLTAEARPRSAWRQAPEGTIEVRQFSFARQVVDRRPVDLVNGEPVEVDGERIYGFIRVFNKGPATTLTMVWSRDGRVVHRYRLGVGRSPSWHTWSLVRATRASRGRWTVSVLDASGASLADQALVIGR